jgi:hypothetical protein
MKQAMVKELDLKENGVITEGHIVRHAYPFILLVPALIYVYQHEGKWYQGKQYVTRRDFRLLQNGTSVGVCYLTRDPTYAILVDFRRTAMNAQYYRSMAHYYLPLAILSGIGASVMIITTIIQIFK